MMKVKSKNSRVKNRSTMFTLYFAWFISLSLLLPFSPSPVAAQTGGTFDLSHNIIASGGSNSSGGQFSLSGTAGQNSAGVVSTNGGFSLRGGFWTFDALLPTSASTSVSGRVTTTNGQGIRNIRVSLTGADGAIRTSYTANFGYFRFDEIEVGQTYILEVSSKKFVFINPTRILTVQDEISDADFVAENQ